MPDEEPGTSELVDRLLATLDLEVEAFAICEVSPGWRLAFGPGDAPTVHYGLTGEGVVRLADGSTFALARDTLLILPPRIGLSFEMPDGSTRELLADPRLLSRVEGGLRMTAGGGEVGFTIACGRIRASCAGLPDLLAYLSAPMAEIFDDPRSLRSSFETILAEVAAPTLGSRALTSALLKQCLVHWLRRRAATGGGLASWMSVLGDARLAKAALLMLERPAEPYTLDQLARLAGMSRAAFASSFSIVLGRPPMEFLKELRLRRAAHLLETTDLPIKAVAGRVGYSSRSYFSRAFKELYGVHPRSFRTRPPHS